MDQTSVEFAQRMIEIHRMTLIEQLADLKYRPEEITENTYLYVDQEGHLAGMEKTDVDSYPDDEYMQIGYVHVSAQSLASIRSELALSETLTAAEVADRFRLADDASGGHLAEATVRQAINRGTLHGRKSHGTWLVWLRDARAMKGWVEIERGTNNSTIFTEAEFAQMSDDWLQYFIQFASRNVDLLEEDGLMDDARVNERAHDELIEELKRRNVR